MADKSFRKIKWWSKRKYQENSEKPLIIQNISFSFFSWYVFLFSKICLDFKKDFMIKNKSEKNIPVYISEIFTVSWSEWKYWKIFVKLSKPSFTVKYEAFFENSRTTQSLFLCASKINSDLLTRNKLNLRQRRSLGRYFKNLPKTF